MKTVIIEFQYLNLTISKSVNLIEIFKSMPPALKIETLIELLETLDNSITLEEFQKVIFKKRVNHINKILSTSSDDIFNNKIWIDE